MIALKKLTIFFFFAHFLKNYCISWAVGAVGHQGKSRIAQNCQQQHCDARSNYTLTNYFDSKGRDLNLVPRNSG